ncbi:MAG: AAA family ATPase [Fimbriimonadaceae bacterium]
MRLLKFRVKNFRSVQDSDWIDIGGVTSLIGTNESGKTNLLTPLWKLNPANDGAINEIADYPRSRYQEFRAMVEKPVFIEATFELGEELAKKISDIAGIEKGEVLNAHIGRDFGGKYFLQFPDAGTNRSFRSALATWKLTYAVTQIRANKTDDSDEVFVARLIKIADEAKLTFSNKEKADKDELDSAYEIIDDALTAEEKIDPLGMLLMTAAKSLKSMSESVEKNVQDCEGVWTAVKGAMPKFVYYSNYGNLDSEIHLGRVIEDMQRTDLGPKSEARIRTLKVLFEFVGLSPQEIRQLGSEPEEPSSGFTEDQLAKFAEQKKERTILLKSASSKLTKEFREWWLQGKYVFDLQADGDFFKVWVHDEQRPEPIELEGRSTGLQWFLSFFLIFLVESSDTHANTVILLDEPGLSLHPIAQKDLFRFFGKLSESNQLIYTTHSPFLVDPDHLDFVRAVYVDGSGLTSVSADLRAGVNAKQTFNSIYPVHAALGLSVSETLFQGCQPIIVEGVSDQIYLSAIKTLLIRKKKIAPKRELLFVPSGGAKGATTVASILAGKDEVLPVVLLDGDTIGQSSAKSLKSGLYEKSVDRVIDIGVLLSMPGAEIEDVLPRGFMAERVVRTLPRTDPPEFDAFWDQSKPIIPQIRKFSEINGIELPEGWKVQLAIDVKQQLLSNPDRFLKDDELVKSWVVFFNEFVE